MPLPRLVLPVVFSALLLAACAGGPAANLPADQPGGADVCTLPTPASAAQRAVAAACTPQAGDQVTPAQRRQIVRALAQPLDRLNTQRHQRVMETRSRATPQTELSVITTDVEPGPRTRMVIFVPAAQTQRVEALRVGEDTWIRLDHGPWQRDPAAGPVELETVAVLAQSSILAMRQHTQDGRQMLTVDTVDNGLGFKRERRIHADLTRGLITQIDAVDMDEIETTMRYLWEARFDPIVAPTVAPTPAPRAAPARPRRAR